MLVEALNLSKLVEAPNLLQSVEVSRSTFGTSLQRSCIFCPLHIVSSLGLASFLCVFVKLLYRFERRVMLPIRALHAHTLLSNACMSLQEAFVLPFLALIPLLDAHLPVFEDCTPPESASFAVLFRSFHSLFPFCPRFYPMRCPLDTKVLSTARASAVAPLACFLFDFLHYFVGFAHLHVLLEGIVT